MNMLINCSFENQRNNALFILILNKYPPKETTCLNHLNPLLEVRK